MIIRILTSALRPAVLLLLQELVSGRSGALDAQHARKRWVCVREHQEVVVPCAQLHLEVLELGMLADVHAAEAEKSTNAGTENSRERNALGQISIPEHVHLLLFLLFVGSDQSLELAVGESCLQRTDSRPLLGLLTPRGHRLALDIGGIVLLFGVVGLGELEDGIDHELVIGPGGGKRVQVEGIEAIDECGVEVEGSGVGIKPLLKYTFKIKAYSPHLIEHFLAVLVERALGRPARQQQVQREASVVVVVAAEAQQLAHAQLILHYHRILHLPPRLLDHHRHHYQLDLVQHQQSRSGPQRLVDRQPRSQRTWQRDGPQNRVHLAQLVALVHGECARVAGWLVEGQLLGLILPRLSVAHLIMYAGRVATNSVLGNLTNTGRSYRIYCSKIQRRGKKAAREYG